MAVFRPFKAIRPIPERAKDVAALPYDVMNSDEAREMVKGNPYSFLHVDKAEIDLDPSIDLYDEKVYLKARENLDKLVTDGVCKEDETPCIYIYRQIMNGRSQTGLVGCTAIDDYINNVIKKHELTRADKEADRINHVDYCDANTGPIFLTYRPDAFISKTVEAWKENHAPVYDFVSEGVENTVWVIDDADTVKAVTDKFAQIESLYIADGHHRSAAAALVGDEMARNQTYTTGDEEFNYYMAVCFPSDELTILDYNRVVKDLNGMGTEEFLQALSKNFKVELKGETPYRPDHAHEFSLYLDGKWYSLEAKAGTFDETDPIGVLDVDISSRLILGDLLNIHDLRKDKRIDFVGGLRGLEELQRRVDSGEMRMALALYPVDMEQIMNIADSGNIMPPKATWFEPKLRSGLVVHKF